MTYKVLLHKKAQSYFYDLSTGTQKRIKKALTELSSDPKTKRPLADIIKLSGTKGRDSAYRIRVGDYRIVYAIERRTVYVTLIFHRGKDYQEL